MTLAGWEAAIRLVGLGVLAFAWVTAGLGAATGGTRPPGRAGRLARRYRAQIVYLVGAVPYFAVCALLWRRLPGTVSIAGRIVLLAVGTGLGSVGAALYLSGRRELGAMYNVSSSLGSELYADHVLVTTGPYAYVRHPMYLGLALAAAGGLAVYRTWTLVFMCLTLIGAALKARLEDHLLAAEFGSEWQHYAAAVPGWRPRLRPNPVKEDDRERQVRPAGPAAPRGP